MEGVVTRPEVDHDAHATDGHPTVQISSREIRDTAARALVAAGASWGEAAIAAEVATLAQVHDGDGIRALLDELGLLRSRRTGTRADLSSNPIVLRGSPHRGSLLLAPAAVDLCIGTGRDVVVDGPRCLTAWPWAAVIAAERHGVGLTVAEQEGSSTRVVAAVTADGTLRRPRSSPASTTSDGVLVTLAPGDPGSEASFLDSTPAVRHARARTVLDDGAAVDADSWRRLRAAAHAFLVPEPREA